MKHVLTQTAIIVTSFALVVGCASNTRSENTGVGAATGAVVGGIAGATIGSGTGAAIAGAAVGAVVGGMIGHSMDSHDQHRASYAMEHNKKHKAKHWRNKKSGARYSFAPTSQTYAANGNNQCRDYRVTMSHNGQQQTNTGTACRQADGNWQAIQG